MLSDSIRRRLLAFGTGCALFAHAPLEAQIRPALDAEHARELDALQPRIDGAIDRGVVWLLDHQQRDGSYAFQRETFAPGQTALCAYTLMKSGLPPQHSAVRRAIAHIEDQHAPMVYAAACQVLALAQTRDPAHVPRVRAILERFVDEQSGTWTYPNPGGAIRHLHSDRDLSITQFALLAFRAGNGLGIAPPKRALRDAFDDTLKYQAAPDPALTGEPIAGFRYRWGERGDATGSMTTAGIAVSMIAAELLDGELGRKREQQLTEAKRQALGWLAANFAVRENPNKGRSWLYYYLYGLERVGALLGTEYIGEHPWYLEGARFLVEVQAEDGSWTEANNEADTCFALLFLARATMPTTGGSRRVPKLTIDARGKGHEVGLQARGATDGTPLQIWITDLDGIDPHAETRAPTPIVERVDYLADGEVIASVTARHTGEWQGENFLAEHRFATDGNRQLTARVHTLTRQDGGPLVPGDALQSSPATVTVDHTLEGWMLDAAVAGRRNQLRGIEARATATSVQGEHAPFRAIDGDAYSAWRFAPSDAAPTLTLQLDKAVRADVLRVSQVNGLRVDRGQFDRITKLSIQINRDAPIEVECPPNELAPTLIDLGKARVRRLVVRVLERSAGSKFVGVGGIAELGLELRER